MKVYNNGYLKKVCDSQQNVYDRWNACNSDKDTWFVNLVTFSCEPQRESEHLLQQPADQMHGLNNTGKRHARARGAQFGPICP